MLADSDTSLLAVSAAFSDTGISIWTTLQTKNDIVTDKLYSMGDGVELTLSYFRRWNANLFFCAHILWHIPSIYSRFVRPSWNSVAIAAYLKQLDFSSDLNLQWMSVSLWRIPIQTVLHSGWIRPLSAASLIFPTLWFLRQCKEPTQSPPRRTQESKYPIPLTSRNTVCCSHRLKKNLTFTKIMMICLIYVHFQL